MYYDNTTNSSQPLMLTNAKLTIGDVTTADDDVEQPSQQQVSVDPSSRLSDVPLPPDVRLPDVRLPDVQLPGVRLRDVLTASSSSSNTASSAATELTSNNSSSSSSMSMTVRNTVLSSAFTPAMSEAVRSTALSPTFAPAMSETDTAAASVFHTEELADTLRPYGAMTSDVVDGADELFGGSLQCTETAATDDVDTSLDYYSNLQIDERELASLNERDLGKSWHVSV